MILIYHGLTKEATESYQVGQRTKSARFGVPFFVNAFWVKSVLQSKRFTVYPCTENSLVSLDKKIKVRKEVYFFTNMHIGDNFLSVPAILKYLKLNPGTDAVIVTQESHRCIWSQYNRVKFLNLESYNNRQDRNGYYKIIINGLEHTQPLDKVRNRCVNIADIVDIPLDLTECFNTFTWIKFDKPNKMKNVKNPIGIQLRSQDNLRTWDPTLVKQKALCKIITDKGIGTPVLFDANSLNLKWKGCIDMTGKLDEKNYINAIAYCKFVIVCGDTGAEHIAGNLKIPFIALFTAGFRPECRLSHYDKWGAIEIRDMRALDVFDVYNKFYLTYEKFVKK